MYTVVRMDFIHTLFLHDQTDTSYSEPPLTQLHYTKNKMAKNSQNKILPIQLGEGWWGNNQDFINQSPALQNYKILCSAFL